MLQRQEALELGDVARATLLEPFQKGVTGQLDEAEYNSLLASYNAATSVGTRFEAVLPNHLHRVRAQGASVTTIGSSSSSSATMAASDKPEGVTYIVHANSTLAPHLLPDRLFGQLLVTRVVAPDESRPIDVEALTRAVDKVGASANNVSPTQVYRYSTHGPRVAGDLQAGGDSKPWQEWLDKRTGFLSVLSQERSNSAPAYFIAVQSDAGIAGTELHRSLRERATRSGYMTFADALDDVEFNAVRAASERNAQRLLARVANEANVRVLRMDDLRAYQPTDSTDPLPELVVPDAHTRFNTLEHVGRALGTEGALCAVYNRAAALRGCDRKLVLPVTPERGLVLYNVDTSLLPDNGLVRKVGVPYGVERAVNVAQAQHSIAARSERDVDTRSYLNRTFAWSGRQANRQDNERLYRYADYDERTHGALAARLLGAEQVTTRATLKTLHTWMAATAS